MDWKHSVNVGLSRAVGYRLVRSAPPAGSAEGQPGQRSAGSRTKRRKRPLPRHYDEEARRIIRTVRPRTMTAHEKLYALIVATRHLSHHDVPGAIVECGVWRGGSMQAVALTLLAAGVSERELHLYDTFEGMPPPTEQDRRHDGKSAAELLATTSRAGVFWAVAGLEDVQAGMAETGYPADRVRFHRGMVEDTIPQGAPEQIALLRLDTDWYASTRHELEHLYDRVSHGGVIILDDYGYWAGARQAVDEFLQARNEPLLLVPMASGRIAVKC